MTEKRKAWLEVIALFILVLAAVIMSIAVFVWGWKYTPEYQPAPQNTQAATPDLGELSARVETLENDQAYNLNLFEWKLDQKLLVFGWVALFISSIAGFLGLKTFNDLDKVVKERVNSALEKALYQLDPTYLPIHIYKGRVRRKQKKDEKPRSTARDGLKDVEKRLAMTGLLNVGEITYLDKVPKNGITVIPIDDEADEKEFINIINGGELELNPEEAGFILYAPFGYTIKTAQNVFENTVIANMPATVASMVLVVGRGLKNRKGVSIKKEANQ